MDRRKDVVCGWQEDGRQGEGKTGGYGGIGLVGFRGGFDMAMQEVLLW